MGEEKKVGLGREIGGILKSNIRGYMMYIALLVIMLFFNIRTGGLFLTAGNITNLKLPVALNAMESAEVEPNTEKGEVISTISIAVSSIVTTIIIAVCVLAFRPVLHNITDKDSVFAPAFQQVTPALFGALCASYFAKHWRISIFPILVGVIVYIITPTLAVGTMIFVTIIASVGGALAMWKLKLLK